MTEFACWFRSVFGDDWRRLPEHDEDFDKFDDEELVTVLARGFVAWEKEVNADELGWFTGLQEILSVIASCQKTLTARGRRDLLVQCGVGPEGATVSKKH